MKKLPILFVAALFLAASLGISGSASAAPAKEDVTWELVNPLGGFEVTQLHAPRLDDLAGKTICGLSNNDWQSPRIIPAVLAELQAKYPTAKIIPHTEFPQGTHTIDSDEVAQTLKDKGCQAVVVGNAA